MEFRLLGPVEVRADSGDPIPLRPRLLGILTLLLLNAGHSVTQHSIVERLWGDEHDPPSKDSLYRYITTLRSQVSGAGIRWHRKPGFWGLDVGTDQVDYHRFQRHHALARRAESSDQIVGACRAALGECRDEPLAGIDGPGLAPIRARMDSERQACTRLLVGELLKLGQAATALDVLDDAPRAWSLDDELIALRMRALAAAGKLHALGPYMLKLTQRHRDHGITVPHRLRTLHEKLMRQELPIAEPRRTGSGPAGAEAQWTVAGGVTKRGIPNGSIPRRRTDSAPPHRRQRQDRTFEHASPIPASRAATPSPQAPAIRIPRQLPAESVRPIGHEQKLADILSAVDDVRSRPGLVIVEGLPGVGKSTFALHLAHRIAERFPDGRLYANLQGLDQHATADVLRNFLTDLGSPPPSESSTVDYLSAQLRSVLAERRVLVLLHNARSTEQVHPLLPGHSGCLVVVTSTRRLEGLALRHHAHRTELPPLHRQDSITLLRAQLPGVTARSSALDELAALCGDLPLALRIAATIATRHPGTALTETINDIRRHRIAVLDVDERLALRAAFAAAHDDLHPQARALFPLLALHPGPAISTASAAALAGLPRPDTGRLLDRLAHVRLLDQPDKHGFCLLDLSWDYADTCATEELGETARYAARRRVLDYFPHTAARASEWIAGQQRRAVPGPPDSHVEPDEFADRDGALRWFERNRTDLLAAVELASAQGLHEHAWRIPWASTEFLNLRSLHEDWISTHLVALESARRIDDPEAVQVTEINLANGYLRAQRYDEALSVLSGADERRGEPARAAWRHNSIGWAHTCLSRPSKAIAHHQLALAHFRRSGDRFGHAHSLIYLCWAHTLNGAPETALGHGLPGLDLFEELSELQGIADGNHAVGKAHLALRRFEPAAERFRLALYYWDQSGDLHHGACVLTDLVTLHRNAGEPALARTTWDEASRRLDDLTEHSDSARLRDQLGDRDD